MKVKRINPDLISVQIVHQCLGTDGPVGALIIDNYELNEYEFRNLQVEFAKGLWTKHSIAYSGMCDNEPVKGTINEDGSLTQRLDVLSMHTDYMFELLKHKNSL